MKRFSSLLIVAALVVTCLAFVAFAAQTPTVSVSGATAAPGETVTLSFSLSNNPGFATYRMGITYDKNVLELKSVDAGALSAGVFLPNLDNGQVAFMNATDINGDGILFTATFKILATTSTTTNVGIDMDVSNLGNAAADRLTFEIGGNTVTVHSCADGHIWGDWAVTTNPGCTTPGEETRTCNICHQPETRPINATGHSWSDWAVTTNPGCTTPGEETRTCNTCHQPETRPISATGHSWSEWTVTKAPTHTEHGTESRTCSKCNATETRAIAALGHTIGEEWLYDDQCHWHKCSCGDILDKEDHKLNWVTTKEPTDTEPGLKHQECEICGWRGEDEEIPATSSGTPDPTTPDPTTPDPTTPEPTTPAPTTPEPGTEPDDGCNYILWIIILLMIVALFIILFILFKRKKEKEEEAKNGPETSV